MHGKADIERLSILGDWNGTCSVPDVCSCTGDTISATKRVACAEAVFRHDDYIGSNAPMDVEGL